MLVENFCLVLRSDVPYSEWKRVIAIAYMIVVSRSCFDSLCESEHSCLQSSGLELEATKELLAQRTREQLQEIWQRKQS